ncbi:unnamed protein product [Hymenolepis diminuta]|uniref:Uncharacterized protein n=1 Tax=Hymenolepis diminuta TaxID=6216 RepID=A0A564Y3D7_HYMDI|nr:unnamed protein product [Hymenolepis diminuta]
MWNPNKKSILLVLERQPQIKCVGRKEMVGVDARYDELFAKVCEVRIHSQRDHNLNVDIPQADKIFTQ